jgi:hypothetical protein
MVVRPTDLGHFWLESRGLNEMGFVEGRNFAAEYR